MNTGWSIALGTGLTGLSTLLDQSHRLERRRIALFHEWISPFFLVGGLTFAAQEAIPRTWIPDSISNLSLLSSSAAPSSLSAGRPLLASPIHARKPLGECCPGISDPQV